MPEKNNNYFKEKSIKATLDDLCFIRIFYLIDKLNKIKRICKQNHYVEELALKQNDLKETWMTF